MKIYSILFITLIFFSSCEECLEVSAKPCGGSSTMPAVDLVVIIDASGSMATASQAVDAAASLAIEESKSTCDSDLRVEFFGLEGTFPGVFNSTSRNYLVNLHGSTVALAADRDPAGYGPEQGANAIEDIASLFDWREGACRAIFYISDEELDGCCNGFTNGSSFERYDGTNPAELAKETSETDLAIEAAKQNNVTVFSHHLNVLASELHPDIKALYQKLSDETGGVHTISTSATKELYLDILPDAICNSCNACKLSDFLR